MVYYGTTVFAVLLYHGLPCIHHGIAWRTMFAGDLHTRTRTAVARIPLHQLDYLQDAGCIAYILTAVCMDNHQILQIKMAYQHSIGY